MSELTIQLKPHVERYLKEEIEMDVMLFSANGWNAIVDQYVNILDTEGLRKALLKLLKLPSEIAYIGVKDLLTKEAGTDVGETSSASNVTNPPTTPETLPGSNASFQVGEGNIPTKEYSLEDLPLPLSERFELRSGDDVTALDLPSLVDNESETNSNQPLTGTVLPAIRTNTTEQYLDAQNNYYGPDDTEELFEEMSASSLMTAPMSVEETRQLAFDLGDKGSFLGKYTRFPEHVQSHPYLVLRLPLFTASRKLNRVTDISAEPVGQEYLKKIELQNYEGFNKVTIEGPSMNSTHFFVWDCLIRVFREQANSGLVASRGVAEVSISKFLDYYGLPAKHKNHQYKMMIKNCLNELSKQKLIISGGNGGNLQFEYAKEASLTLIKEYLFDEEQDIMIISAGSSFFNLFKNYHLIPTDVDLIKTFKSEIERIAVLYLTGLPAKGTKIVRLETIINRVKPKDKLNSRELNALKKLFISLKQKGRVDFELDETGKLPAYRNFSHVLQQMKTRPELANQNATPVLKLPRKPRPRPLDEEGYNKLLISWALNTTNSVRRYLDDSSDGTLSCLTLPRIETIIEAGQITGDTGFQSQMQSIIEERRNSKPWLSKEGLAGID